MTKINKPYTKDKKKKNNITQKNFLKKKGGMRLVSFLKNNTTNLLDKAVKSNQDFKIFSTSNNKSSESIINENATKAAYTLGGFMSGFGIGKGSTDEEKIKDLIETSSEHLQQQISSKVSESTQELKDEISNVSKTNSQYLQHQISSQVSNSTQEVKDEIYKVSWKSKKILDTINHKFLTLPSFSEVEGLITQSRETLYNSLGQQLDSMRTDTSNSMTELRGDIQEVKNLLTDTDQPTEKSWSEWLRSFSSSPSSQVRPKNYKEALERLKSIDDEKKRQDAERKRQADIDNATAPLSDKLKELEKEKRKAEEEKQKQADIDKARAPLSDKIKKLEEEAAEKEREDQVRNATAPLINKLGDEQYQRKLLEVESRLKDQLSESKLQHEKEKQMYLLAPLIGIPVIIGCLKLYKNLKKKARKSSPRRSPTPRRSPNYKKSAKKDFYQSISPSEAQRLLKQLEDPFYKLYSPSFVDQLFSLLNKIIDNDYLFYGLLSILTILFFYIHIYKSSKKKSSLMPYFISKFFIGI